MTEYGDYKCEKFKQLDGINDPLFVEWLRQIKELDWDGYQLWIYGGILEWPTYDIDGSVLGGRDSARINYLLDNIVRISFALDINPDIKYSFNGLYDPNLHEKKCINYAFYRGHKYVDGQLIEWTKEKHDDLWQRSRCWPLGKQKKDWQYKSPIQII